MRALPLSLYALTFGGALAAVALFIDAVSERELVPSARLAKVELARVEIVKPLAVEIEPPSAALPAPEPDRVLLEWAAGAPVPAVTRTAHRVAARAPLSPRESARSLLHDVVAAPTLSARLAALDGGLEALPRDAQAAFLARLVERTPGRGDEIEVLRLDVIHRLEPFKDCAPVVPQLLSLLAPDRPRSESMAAIEVLEGETAPLGEPIERQLALLAEGTDDPVLEAHARGLLLTSRALAGPP